MINFLRPVAWIAAFTRGSSQAFTVERSIISRSGGSTAASSGMVGPHILRAAVVVTTSGSFKTRAALAKATTLCFSSPTAISRTPLYRRTW
jgi:hypothetical protein